MPDVRNPGPEYLAFWRERHVCTLTTLRPDGTPHVVPVGVTYDPETRIARVITGGNIRKAAHVMAAGPECARSPRRSRTRYAATRSATSARHATTRSGSSSRSPWTGRSERAEQFKPGNSGQHNGATVFRSRWRRCVGEVPERYGTTGESFRHCGGWRKWFLVRTARGRADRDSRKSCRISRHIERAAALRGAGEDSDRRGCRHPFPSRRRSALRTG